VITFTDITGVKAAEEQKARLAAIVEGSQDAIIGKSLDTTITSWNVAAEKMYGYPAGEAIGQPINMTVPKEKRAELDEIHARIKAGRVVKPFDTERIRKDGRIITVSVAVSGVYSAKGDLTGFSAIYRDLSEQRRAKHELQESEDRFRAMADIAPTMIWMAGPSRKSRFFNKAWLEFTGRSLEQESGDGWAGGVHPKDLASSLAAYSDAYESRQPFKAEYRLRRYDGQYRWMLDHGVPRMSHDGKVIGYIGSCTDIDDQKRASQELEHTVAERTAKLHETIGELESFSYSISHDMRAPLRSMQGFAQLLKNEHGDKVGPEGNEYIDRISNAACRLDHLIQDVLVFSRVGRSELPMQPLDVERLLRSMLQSYPTFRPPQAEINIEGRLPRVLGNEAAMTQCLSNLLGNGVKFVSPGVMPRVRIWAETKDRTVRLWFEDNGIGVAKEYQKKIFGIFERINKNYEGTGIGLAIVQKAIDRMQGRVGVESEIGRGSRFWIELKNGEAESPA
jgi:PAS domain S-box-containing protein